MSHPYSDLPGTAFWKTAVAEADRSAFPGLYIPRYRIGQTTRIATAGSCFAQHITRFLRLAGVPVLDAEPAPRTMSDALRRQHGYGLFSARYGNIYTARQMRELLEEVKGQRAASDLVWPSGGGFVDALRPTIEPDPMETEAEVATLRRYHLDRVGHMLTETDVFIFTLGLVEAWQDMVVDRTLPLCPGVAGGTFDTSRHRLKVFRHAEISDDLEAVLRLLQQFNPAMRLILTVSPVPLTATATGLHVLEATARAKATLRSAASEFVADTEAADYFPSFEIVTHPASGGPFFAPNLRSVSDAGVEKVMAIFLAAHGLVDAPSPSVTPRPEDADLADDDLACDEVLLEAFSG
jgi:hypothetical protein